MMAFIKLISIDGTELCMREGEKGTLNRDATILRIQPFVSYVDESKFQLAKRVSISPLSTDNFSMESFLKLFF